MAVLTTLVGMRIPLVLAVVYGAGLLPSAGVCQWQMQTSNTTADLRGIDNVGGGVAWASGTHGTVLRTEDGGYVWQTCAVPPGAEKLDFRGVQAFDAKTAIVMSSGPGDLSRLYKTTDGCHTWKLLFTNPDKDGFWDALQFDGEQRAVLLGDPVNGEFTLFTSVDAGKSWNRQRTRGLKADPSRAGVFAATNSSLSVSAAPAHERFVTGGAGGAFFIECNGELEAGGQPQRTECMQSRLPVGHPAPSSGAFSIFVGPDEWVVVGGDYLRPDDSNCTAAYTHDFGDSWHAAQTPPHGYRSAVAYDSALKLWVTVGPNGTDVSADDGRNWRAVHPDAALHEAADADRDWNALSLPFVVGPHGRIGRLEAAAVRKKD